MVFICNRATRSSHIQRRLTALAIVAAVYIITVPLAVAQSSFTYAGAFDFTTQIAWTSFINSGTCFSPTCFYLPVAGSGTGQVSSSDSYVGQDIYMQNLADGEAVIWSFSTPQGSQQTILTVTYNQASDCFNVTPSGVSYCGYHDNLGLTAIGDVNSCIQKYSELEIGAWSLNTYDGNTLLYSNPFQVSRNPNSAVGITAPTDNQLVQLSQGNYNASGNLTFSAGTSTGNSINWNVTLHYQSSGGFPQPATDPPPLTFQGTAYTYSGYQGIGGQVNASAQTTASDGSTVKDCTMFFVEGPESGIPNATITARIDQLYPASASYGKYLNDGTARANLFTGVAMKESTYQQFVTPPSNSDLFGVYAEFGIAAKWPYENHANSYTPAGAYIGLLQVPTTDPNAWDWTSNTQTGINVFSGGNSDKVQAAVTYEGYLINGYTNSKTKVSIPAHINGDGSYLRILHGNERENNALVLYAGDVSNCNGSTTCTVGDLYFVPQCPAPGVQVTNKQGNLVCQGGTWQWITNSANQPNGIAYVDYVASHLQ